MDQVIRKKYVLGFLFTEDEEGVALIRKNRPEWQAGLLNGIGGKIEESEMPWDAMIREFFEETGVKTEPGIWKDFCEMTGPDFNVIVYSAKADVKLESKTDEEVRWFRVDELMEWRDKMIENLQWLIPMALSREFAIARVTYYNDNGVNSERKTTP